MPSEQGDMTATMSEREKQLRELEAKIAREKELLEKMRSETAAGAPQDGPLPPPEDPITEPTGSDIPSLRVTPNDLDPFSGPGDDPFVFSENLTLPDDPATEGQGFPGPVPAGLDPLETGPMAENNAAISGEPMQDTGTFPSDQDPMDISNELEVIESDPNAEEIKQYKHDIEEFRSRGYNVSRMYDVFSQDIESIRGELLQYMHDITKLKEIENELDELDTTGFQRDLQSLRRLLKNPDKIEESQSFLNELKERIDSKDSNERSTKIRELAQGICQCRQGVRGSYYGYQSGHH